MPSEFNIILVTIDSCRYDTAVKANTPNLDRIGPLRKAETSGSYTYPAHHAFFTGNIPRILGDEPDYLPGFDQIWRSSSARKTKKTVLKTFEGSTIIDYHQNVGDNVLGFGGVTFFDVNNKNNTLPRLFNNFHYFGDTRNLHPDQRLPRAEETLPLGNIDFIAEKAHFKEPYFLFI